MLSVVSRRARKPLPRQQMGFDFGVAEDALADDDLRDQVLNVFARIPQPHRDRALRALRYIAAAPASERLRAVNDAEERAGGRYTA